MEATIDSAGRILIPKAVRDSLGIGPGDTIDIEILGRNLTLRPKRQGAPSVRKHGITVFRSSHPDPSRVVDETIRALRVERDEHNLGLR